MSTINPDCNLTLSVKNSEGQVENDEEKVL